MCIAVESPLKGKNNCFVQNGLYKKSYEYYVTQIWAVPLFSFIFNQEINQGEKDPNHQ